jgi:FKBP-type peptidyl-prolyl cis-trans isomerase FkpA
MKRINYVLIALVAAAILQASCNKINYKKTKSGLLYKIIPGKGKDSLLRNGNIVKYNIIYKYNDDSVLFSSYGKAPSYAMVQPDAPPYNLTEILPMMRNGDSAIVVQIVDTLLKKGMQIPFRTKKGDRIVSKFRIIEVFASDSIARADYEREMEKDRPRAEKEQEEAQLKQMKEMQPELEAQAKRNDSMRQAQIAELKKSGEVDKELKDMEAYLSSKKIKAQRTGNGTYVSVQDPGTGPEAAWGKWVRVKYSGKVLATDSVFQSSVYPFRLGVDGVIAGWEEGLKLFKKGGKGTLYIPGFLAYGKDPGPAGKPYAALIFDIELLDVSDNPILK